jgi:hypothetical protein
MPVWPSKLDMPFVKFVFLGWALSLVGALLHAGTFWPHSCVPKAWILDVSCDEQVRLDVVGARFVRTRPAGVDSPVTALRETVRVLVLVFVVLLLTGLIPRQVQQKLLGRSPVSAAEEVSGRAGIGVLAEALEALLEGPGQGHLELLPQQRRLALAIFPG